MTTLKSLPICIIKKIFTSFDKENDNILNLKKIYNVMIRLF